MLLAILLAATPLDAGPSGLRCPVADGVVEVVWFNHQVLIISPSSRVVWSGVEEASPACVSGGVELTRWASVRLVFRDRGERVEVDWSQVRAQLDAAWARPAGTAAQSTIEALARSHGYVTWLGAPADVESEMRDLFLREAVWRDQGLIHFSAFSDTPRGRALEVKRQALLFERAPVVLFSPTRLGTSSGDQILWRGDNPCVTQNPEATIVRCFDRSTKTWSKPFARGPALEVGTGLQTACTLRGRHFTVEYKDPVQNTGEFGVGSVTEGSAHWPVAQLVVGPSTLAHDAEAFAFSPSGKVGVASVPMYSMTDETFGSGRTYTTAQRLLTTELWVFETTPPAAQ